MFHTRLDCICIFLNSIIIDVIVLKAVCAFAKWFTQYGKLPFMEVYKDYTTWRTCYAGCGISHESAYRILSRLINDRKICTSLN